MKIKFCTSLLILFFFNLHLSAQFTEQTISPAALLNNSYSSVAWGDYNNDSKLDILITGLLGSKLYRNRGGNTFIEVTGLSMPKLAYSTVAWGDYDNDGDLDFVIAGFNTAEGPLYGNTTTIYNNDAGVFNMLPARLTGISRGTVAWGDYDNDGDLDLLVTGDTTSTGLSGITKIYKNMGRSVFSEQTSIVLIGISAGASAAWADYDRDGDLDLVLSGGINNGNSRISKIYKNDFPINSFTEQPIVLYPLQASSLAWGDYDNDGDPDLLLTGLDTTFLYKNNYPLNTFSQITVSPAGLTGVGQGSVKWGDYDNDGKLDIFLSGHTRGWPGVGPAVAKLYRNGGGNTFREVIITPVPLKGVSLSSLALGDYNNDGRLDLLLTGKTDDAGATVTKLYRNTGGVIANTAPSVPTDFTISVEDGFGIFHWTRSHDNTTPQDGLQYNLAISTDFRSVNKLSPMADLGNGYRRVPAAGNTNYMNSWAIKGFSGGIWGRTYYCAVQAIDNSYAGSPFNVQKIYVKGWLQKNRLILVTIFVVMLALFYLMIRRRKKKTPAG
ncbi:MAG: VCBS repeat-containing protein [Ferruginibacter sp.]